MFLKVERTFWIWKCFYVLSTIWIGGIYIVYPNH